MKGRNSSFKVLESLAFVGVLIVEQRKIVYANKAAEKVFGWAFKELSETPLSLIFSKEAYEIFLEPLSQFEKGNLEAMQIDFSCRRADGENVYCVLSLSVNQRGQIIISLDINAGNSVQDPLTGLYNRRAFFALAEHGIAMAKRFERDIYLVCIDVDDLKIVNDNDRLGHLIGDELLVAVADILRASFRTSDVIARFGGDEFFVLAITEPGTKNILVERLRVQTQQKSREFLAKHGYPISLSVGMVCYNLEQSFQDLIKEADRLMYLEKNKKKRKV